MITTKKDVLPSGCLWRIFSEKWNRGSSVNALNILNSNQNPGVTKEERALTINSYQEHPVWFCGQFWENESNWLCCLKIKQPYMLECSGIQYETKDYHNIDITHTLFIVCVANQEKKSRDFHHCNFHIVFLIFLQRWFKLHFNRIFDLFQSLIWTKNFKFGEPFFCVFFQKIRKLRDNDIRYGGHEIWLSDSQHENERIVFILLKE